MLRLIAGILGVYGAQTSSGTSPSGWRLFPLAIGCACAKDPLGRPAAGCIPIRCCLPLGRPRSCDEELVGRPGKHSLGDRLGGLVPGSGAVLHLGPNGLGAYRGTGAALVSDGVLDPAACLSPSEDAQ